MTLGGLHHYQLHSSGPKINYICEDPLEFKFLLIEIESCYSDP